MLFVFVSSIYHLAIHHSVGAATLIVRVALLQHVAEVHLDLRVEWDTASRTIKTILDLAVNRHLDETYRRGCPVEDLLALVDLHLEILETMIIRGSDARQEVLTIAVVSEDSLNLLS